MAVMHRVFKTLARILHTNGLDYLYLSRNNIYAFTKRLTYFNQGATTRALPFILAEFYDLAYTG